MSDVCHAFFSLSLSNVGITSHGLPFPSVIMVPDLIGVFLLLFPRYEDALVLLLTEVLNRIQFRYNQAQLEELDDETLDDDVRSRRL